MGHKTAIDGDGREVRIKEHGPLGHRGTAKPGPGKNGETVGWARKGGSPKNKWECQVAGTGEVVTGFTSRASAIAGASDAYFRARHAEELHGFCEWMHKHPETAFSRPYVRASVVSFGRMVERTLCKECFIGQEVAKPVFYHDGRPVEGFDSCHLKAMVDLALANSRGDEILAADWLTEQSMLRRGIEQRLVEDAFDWLTERDTVKPYLTAARDALEEAGRTHQGSVRIGPGRAVLKGGHAIVGDLVVKAMRPAFSLAILLRDHNELLGSVGQESSVRVEGDVMICQTALGEFRTKYSGRRDLARVLAELAPKMIKSGDPRRESYDIILRAALG